MVRQSAVIGIHDDFMGQLSRPLASLVVRVWILILARLGVLSRSTPEVRGTEAFRSATWGDEGSML